ncbi:MAG: DnaA/Hda family protein [Chlamydiales bacterium]|nr:DnaA/Hda family protein [Chlamydiales bacterium]
MLAWNEFLSQLERELGAHVVDEWLRPLRILQFDAANLYLEAEHSFQIHWFEEHIRPRLKKEFLNNNLRPITVHLKSASQQPPKTSRPPAPSSTYAIKPDPLENDFTFEHFFSSEDNIIPYRLLKELHSPSLALGTFNPLFLYGPKHSGKTHLLMAAAHALSPHKRVFFVRAETFTDHVVQAIRLGAMQAFRQAYRDIDVLIVDDIHIFAKKNATQEEFFHTFNTLHTLGRQIILSANTAPTSLPNIEERLISRFEWGLSTSIKPFTDLKQILQRKALLWRLSVHSAVYDFLIENIPSRAIQALQALALRSHETHIDLSSAQKLLQDFLAREKQEAVTPQQIIQSIASHFGIKAEDLLGKAQTKEFALPRQIAMYACRHQLNMPFQAIGKLFNRDHSTVMGSVKQIQQGIDEKRQDLLQALGLRPKPR